MWWQRDKEKGRYIMSHCCPNGRAKQQWYYWLFCQWHKYRPKNIGQPTHAGKNIYIGTCHITKKFSYKCQTCFHSHSSMAFVCLSCHFLWFYKEEIWSLNPPYPYPPCHPIPIQSATLLSVFCLFFFHGMILGCPYIRLNNLFLVFFVFL